VVNERRVPPHSAFPAGRISVGPASVTVPGLGHPKKVGDPDTLVASHSAMVPVVDDAQRRAVSNTFDLHEASFIGDVKASAQRRPRGRCWVCRAKTTYECKLCSPGPVPLCNRTARECWWKYHAGEITQFVPNKRGRKRRKSEHNDVHDGEHDGEDSEDDVDASKVDPDATNVGSLLG